MNFRKLNNLSGWITGGIATLVYLLTMEPTVSFWDCGEFLSCAYNLEVGHSPGAPLFMMIQRIAGLFAGSREHAALSINAWSAIASGFTITFLFWTITYLAGKIAGVSKKQEPNTQQKILILGAGLIGALAYTFSDTFWYSAVEAEVYATSSLCTAIVFWAIFKWEAVSAEKYADKWLVLIAYVMGLSLGIHLLNLLVIPALAMVYYFNRYEYTLRGAVIAFLAGCVGLLIVQFGVLQWLPVIASGFEIVFVNNFGLPFDSGAITFIVLLVAALTASLVYAKRKGMYLLHTGMLCLCFVILGFFSYLAPIIRSRADVPVDMTNPDNSVSLIPYIKREQFKQQPLLYGPDFNSNITGYKKTGTTYSATKKNGKDYYEEVDTKTEPEYEAGSERFFPRIWDNKDAGVTGFYKDYLGIEDGAMATSGDNMKFFWGYQLNWMWWRYFMWNYAGRQNDVQGQGDAKNGNWISGLGLIDNTIRGLGDMDKAGSGYKDNAARNEMYMLPYILGILGIIIHVRKNKRDFATVLVLFLVTGAGLAVYLNMGPVQARERDYAFAGSTYAYAIWIGLGVMLTAQLLQRFVQNTTSSAYAAAGLCLLLVPVIMAKAEWNDHDRSKKTFVRASAWNALQSCAPNAILFTFGDNYTYPLWYLQEVEGIRRDVRVLNLGLLSADWYIDQLNYKVNDADAVPMIWKKEDYVGRRHGYIPYRNNTAIPKDTYINLEEVCKFLVSNKQEDKIQAQNGESLNYYPAKNFFVATPDKMSLVNSGWINAADTGHINASVRITYPKDAMSKSTITLYNIIAAVAKEGWKRPIYFGDGVTPDDLSGFDGYARMEGCVYRLLPFKYTDSVATAEEGLGSVDVNKSYDLFMNKYIWGGAERNDVYFDSKNRLMLTTYRFNAGRIANELIAKGRKAEAIKLLDHVIKNITEHSYYYDPITYYMIVAYYHAGATEKASALAQKTAKNAIDDIKYTLTLGEEQQEKLTAELRNDMSIVRAIMTVAKSSGDENTANMLNQRMGSLMQELQQQQR